MYSRERKSEHNTLFTSKKLNSPSNSSLRLHTNTNTNTMENIGDEYKHYWETNMFLQTEELDSWGLDEAFSGYYDSSSPDGTQSSSPASKNIVSERNRRRKLNERLFALRSVVPNISKMDKASIIKDAIDYIQELQDQERRIQAEISELESGKLKKNSVFDYDQEMPKLSRPKKKKIEQFCDYGGPRTSPIEILELRVSDMGEKTVLVSLTCSKRTDTMVKLCEVFESLKLKIITTNITAFSGRLLKTVFVEADEDEKDHLKRKIQTAIAALSGPESPLST